MNKEELVKEIAEKAKLSQKATGEIVGAVLETIQKTVSKGKKVTLVGFGSFEARKRAARTGRNPQTGKAKELLELAATLKQVKKLKLLQKQFLHFQPVKNSKNLLTKNSFLEFFENNLKRYGFHTAFIFVIATI